MTASGRVPLSESGMAAERYLAVARTYVPPTATATGARPKSQPPYLIPSTLGPVSAWKYMSILAVHLLQYGSKGSLRDYDKVQKCRAVEGRGNLQR